MIIEEDISMFFFFLCNILKYHSSSKLVEVFRSSPSIVKLLSTSRIHLARDHRYDTWWCWWFTGGSVPQNSPSLEKSPCDESLADLGHHQLVAVEVATELQRTGQLHARLLIHTPALSPLPVSSRVTLRA